MDADRFEAVLRILAEAPSRRDLARRLVGLTLSGPIAMLGLSTAEAKHKKRKRRKKREKHKKHKKKEKGCNPNCPQCQTCIPATNQCVPLPDTALCDDGDACTLTDTCRGGICVGGDPVNCDSGQRCVDGTCICDATSCATGCCEGTTCHLDDDAACGTSGGGCTACTGTTPSCGGGDPPTPGVCGCIPPGDPCNIGNPAQCCSQTCAGPVGGPFACL